MNFFISVLSTLLLGLVVGFALSLQSAEPPTEFEKYSSATMDYNTMSEVGYAMAAYGRKSTAEYFELKDYQAYDSQQKLRDKQSKAKPDVIAQTPNQIEDENDLFTSELQKGRALQVAEVETAKAETAKPAQQAKSSRSNGWPKAVVGIKRESELMKAADVWQAFSEQSSLSNQLDSYTISVFAIYSNFNSDYSRATISIGYDKPGMKGDSFTMPIGETQSLLKPSNYGNNELVNAWQDIDYSRTVKAVVERRDYTQNSELTSLFVIYQ